MLLINRNPARAPKLLPIQVAAPAAIKRLYQDSNAVCIGMQTVCKCWKKRLRSRKGGGRWSPGACHFESLEPGSPSLASPSYQESARRLGSPSNSHDSFLEF